MRAKKFGFTLIAVALSLFTFAYFIMGSQNMEAYADVDPAPAHYSLMNIITVTLLLLASASLIFSFRTLKPQNAYWGIAGYILTVNVIFAYIYSEKHRLGMEGLFLPIPQALFIGTLCMAVLTVLFIVFRLQILKLLTWVMSSSIDMRNKQPSIKALGEYREGCQSETFTGFSGDREPIKDYNQPEAVYPPTAPQQQREQ